MTQKPLLQYLKQKQYWVNALMKIQTKYIPNNKTKTTDF